MKIIIVGAGIGGLTLAAACQRFGIEARIYEQTSELKNIGGGVLIWPHGQRYLTWLGLANVLSPFDIQSKNCTIAGRDGAIMYTENYASFNTLIGGKILPIERHLLQKALLAQLPKDTLLLNKQCISVRSNRNEATVEFADGTSASADLIVGADGIHSCVRKYINPNCDLLYTNNCWWGGIIQHSDTPSISPHDTYVALERGKMCIVWPCKDDKMMWYLPVKMPANTLDRTVNCRQQLQNICANWSPAVQEIIAAKSSSYNFQIPIYQLAPQQRWVKDRVVIIGDAAHALGPILGQGTSQAIEDVYVLLNYLRGTTKIDDSLAAYDQSRHERYETLNMLEIEATNIMVNDAPNAMEIFESIIPNVDLAAMYYELIPHINEQACIEIAEEVNAKEVPFLKLKNYTLAS